MELTTVTCVKETETKDEHKWGEDQSSLTVRKDVKKTQQQRIKGCELCCACNEIIGNFAMKAELSCSFSISVPITILSRRHHKIKKLCSDILNMICSKVISRAFHTGKDRRRVRSELQKERKRKRRRKVISPPFANGTLATAQGEISLYGC